MPTHLDSPADSSTSHKAGIISHNRRHLRSSSFPFIKSLNPFRRKSSPTPPCPNERPAKPYEVAPGIWSTDATAKVFGYLDPDEDEHKKRSKSAGPDKRNRSRDRCSKEKGGGCSPARRLYERYKEAHADDGLDDFRGRTHRRKVEEWDRKRQERRDEARKERDESARRGRRGRMLTAGKEDALVSRGANPRTGVVTPWEGSEVSGEGGCWLGRGRGDKSGPKKSRESSGKWTQEENGWSLVQDPDSSPARSVQGGPTSRNVSVKEVEDKFVVNTPGADDPNPPSVMADNIRFYQEGVERACKEASGSHGLVDPDARPTPRTKTPEGPSTPPTKLQKIRRKEVGSAVSERNNSTDTVLVFRQATVATVISPTSRDDMRETPRFKVIPPSSTVSPASKCPNRDHQGLFPKQIHTQRPFLDPRADEETFLIANVTPSPCLSSTTPKRSPPRHMEPDPEEATFVPQPLFRTLSQYLPPLSFLHPSYFARLPESYQNPTQRISENLKEQPRGQHASTITTPITTTTTTEKKQRPRVARLDGTNSVPRANLHAFEGQRKWWDQRKKQTETKLVEERSDRPPNKNPTPAAQRVQKEPPPENEHWKKGEKYNGWVVADPSTDETKAPRSDEKVGDKGKGKKSTSTCICMKCKMRRSRGSKVMQPTERILETRSGNIVGEHTPKNKARERDGCIRTDDRLGDGTVCDRPNGRSLGLRMRAMANGCRRRVEELQAHEEPLLEVPLDGEAIVGGNAWFEFAGRWGDGKERDEIACIHGGVEDGWKEGREGDDDEEGKERLEIALAKTMVGMWNAVCEMEKTFHASSRARRVYMGLLGMVQHVLITLNPASPALKMLRRKDARVEDYVRAVRDLVLAGVYLLVLLNIIMTAGKAVRVTMRALLCAWWPVKAALAVVRWFALG